MIWFMAPDLPEASGGIKMIYRMVEELGATGRPAVVWHGGEHHRYATFSSTAPVHRGMTASLAPGDVLVMQEVGGPRWSFLAGQVPLVMLCQGWSFVFQDIGADDVLPSGYPGWPRVQAALATSRYIERVVTTMSGPALPVHRVTVTVDGSLFRPRDKRRVVAYMPRRRRMELAAAVQLLRRTGRLPDWEFRALDGISEQEVARHLGEAAVFMSGAEREGFGLPAAEAMAAGCYVVGFTGDGGAEFMDPADCTVIHDSDVLSLADGVADAARLFDGDRPGFEATVARARDRVLERYNRDGMRASLDAAFEAICAPGSPAVVTAPAVVPHYQSHAPKPGWRHEAYRWLRRRARRTLDAMPRR